MVMDTFEPFEIGLPVGRRYWEDESTGLSLKRGQTTIVQRKHARSAELRFALMRSQVLIKSGVHEFAFREKIVKVRPGENKNLIVDRGVNEEYPIEKALEPIIIEEKPLEPIIEERTDVPIKIKEKTYKK
jgi:hypothetical protein